MDGPQLSRSNFDLTEAVAHSDDSDHGFSTAKSLFHDAYEHTANVLQHPTQHISEITTSAAALALLIASRGRIAAILSSQIEEQSLARNTTYVSSRLEEIGDQTASLVRQSHANISSMLKTEPVVGAFRERLNDLEGGMSERFYHQYYGGEGATTAEAFQAESTSKLDTMLSDKGKSLAFDGAKYRGPSDGTFLGQGTFAIAPMEEPLATNHLVTCAGVVVQNEKAGLHYLAHLDIGVSAKQLEASLKNFPLADSNIYLLPGPSPSPVWDLALRTIDDLKSATTKTWLVRPEEGQKLGSIISHAGKVFSGRSVALGRWNAFKIIAGDSTDELFSKLPPLADGVK